MSRLLVLADTHMPGRAQRLPEEVVRAIQDVDAIVHLGDFTDVSVADALERTAPLYAVHGNNDPDEIRRRYPLRRDLTIAGHHLVLIHGHVGGRSAKAAARSIRGAEIVLYGHSHIPHLERRGDVLHFNPGSPTDRRQAPFKAYGIINIGETIDARIIPLDGII